jgi:beta-galactosidase
MDDEPTGARPTRTGRQIPIEETYGNPGPAAELEGVCLRYVAQLPEEPARRDSRARGPRQFITTNMMGWFDAYDHYTVSQDLDLASWDDYVGSGPALNPVRNGARMT